MESKIPPTSELRAELERLSTAQLRWLADTSGVPYTTLWKIRDGTTTNPGIETVRKYQPHIREAERAVAKRPARRLDGPSTHREQKGH